MQMADMETERLWICGTRKSGGASCLDIWLDNDLGKYMVDPPKDKAGEDELNFAVYGVPEIPSAPLFRRDDAASA